MSLEDDRCELAEFLFRHGPTHGPALRRALGWDMARFWDAVYGTTGGWFTVTTDGWSLVEQDVIEWGARDEPVCVISR